MPALLAVLRRLGFCLGVGIALWTAGLLWFARPLAVKDDGAPTDAIVVLTGGSLRLQSGLALLGEGKGRKLFVSGVNQEVKLGQLLRLAGNAPDWAACCVVLGYDADDTLGNALETARWMRRENYRSLRLVTAWYHMRRSLLEFERAMPGITIIPHPVYPDRARLSHWWEWRGTPTPWCGDELDPGVRLQSRVRAVDRVHRHPGVAAVDDAAPRQHALRQVLGAHRAGSAALYRRPRLRGAGSRAGAAGRRADCGQAPVRLGCVDPADRARRSGHYR